MRRGSRAAALQRFRPTGAAVPSRPSCCCCCSSSSPVLLWSGGPPPLAARARTLAYSTAAAPSLQRLAEKMERQHADEASCGAGGATQAAPPHSATASDATSTASNPLERSSTLLARIVEQTRLARQSGALRTIHTRCQLIEDAASAAAGGPLKFPVRIKKEGEAYLKPDVLADNIWKRDPFLPPYEKDLFVEWDFSVGPADSPQSKHVILLNKFNVLPNHALIVTTEYQSQSEPLNEADFDTFWRSVYDVQGFGFYNCGVNAGPSQPHKHMQVVPLPLEDGMELPLLRVLDQFAESKSGEESAIYTIPCLQFKHALCCIPPQRDSDSMITGKQLMEMYSRLLLSLDLGKAKARPTPFHHNVLLSPRWLIVVPRTQEGMDGLSGNGLVFAGVFFTKDQQLCDRLATIGVTDFLVKLTT